MAEYFSKGLKGASGIGILGTMMTIMNNSPTCPYYQFRSRSLSDKHRIFDDPNVITLKEDEYKIWEEKWDKKRNKHIEWKESWDKRRKVED